MAISSLLQQLDSFKREVCPSTAQLIKGKSRRKLGSHSELEEGGNKEARSHAPHGKGPRSWLMRSLLAWDVVDGEHVSEAWTPLVTTKEKYTQYAGTAV